MADLTTRNSRRRLLRGKDRTWARIARDRGDRKSWKEAQYTFDAHVVPAWGDVPMGKLTTGRLRRWHEGTANKPARTRSPEDGEQRYREATTEDEKRARKATANRNLSTLKAALNRAWRDRKLSVGREAWQRVRAVDAEWLDRGCGLGDAAGG